MCKATASLSGLYMYSRRRKHILLPRDFGHRAKTRIYQDFDGNLVILDMII